jgi:hypothetical protein
MEAYAFADVNPFSEAYQHFNALVTRLQSHEALAMTHSQLESLLQVEGFELLRLLLQAHLDVRAGAEVCSPPVSADGRAYTQVRSSERGLMSLFGPVRVGRLAYGAPPASSLHPLDGDLNLPEELYSHGISRRVAQEAAKNCFDEVVGALQQTTGASVPKRQVEQLARRAAADFEEFYARRAVEPRPRQPGEAEPAGSLLVLSVDGKGVTMRRGDLRAATRQAAEASSAQRDKRLSPGEKPHQKRMATVASVYTIQPFERQPEEIVAELKPTAEAGRQRPRPENKRVWASLEKEPEQVIEEVFREATARDLKRDKQWVALVDGNPTQLSRLEQMAQRYQVGLVIVLDIIHVLGYLWKAALAFHPEDTKEAQLWVSQRLLEILRGRSSSVAGGIRRSATLRHLGGTQREAADKCADYLLKYGKYLRYDQYLRAGFPIATGVIEGACRHLVQDRMEKTGARWSLKGAEAVLRLRSLWASEDFEEYWPFHEKQELKRNHQTRYADGQVPSLKPAQVVRCEVPHLRLVK